MNTAEQVEIQTLIRAEIEMQMNEQSQRTRTENSESKNPLLFWKKKKDWCKHRTAELKILLVEFRALHQQKIDYDAPNFKTNYYAIQDNLQLLIGELSVLKTLYYCWLFEEYNIPLSTVSSYLAIRPMMSPDQVAKNQEQIFALINTLSAILPQDIMNWLEKENHLEEVIHSFHFQGYSLGYIVQQIHQWKQEDQVLSCNVWQDQKHSSAFFMAKKCKRFLDLLESFVSSKLFFDFNYYLLMDNWSLIHDFLADKEPFDWLCSSGKQSISKNHRALIKHLTRIIHTLDNTLAIIVQIKGS